MVCLSVKRSAGARSNRACAPATGVACVAPPAASLGDQGLPALHAARVEHDVGHEARQDLPCASVGCTKLATSPAQAATRAATRSDGPRRSPTSPATDALVSPSTARIELSDGATMATLRRAGSRRSLRWLSAPAVACGMLAVCTRSPRSASPEPHQFRRLEDGSRRVRTARAPGIRGKVVPVRGYRGDIVLHPRGQDAPATAGTCPRPGLPAHPPRLAQPRDKRLRGHAVPGAPPLALTRPARTSRCEPWARRHDTQPAPRRPARIRTTTFPPRPPRLRDDPVAGDGLCLLEQAHPDRPAFYAVRVRRCRVSPRASFPQQRPARCLTNAAIPQLLLLLHGT